MAWGIVRGTQRGYQLGKPQPEATVVNAILKSATMVKLLLKTPKVSTREICNALEERGIPLPWDDLRDKGEAWGTSATEPKVKMAISHARLTAKQVASDERWLHLTNNAGDGGLFDKFRLKQRRK